MNTRVGIELELWVVDRKGRLRSARPLVEALDFVDPELVTPLVEVKTDPALSTSELRAQLRRRLSSALAAADRERLRVFALGTALNRGPLRLVESRRFRLQRRVTPREIETERRLARAGLHVHFSHSGERRPARDRINLLTALDPVAAVLNSSPYGAAVAAASSSRNFLYRYGRRLELPGHSTLWPYARTVEDWQREIDRRFRQFERLARWRGVSSGLVRRIQSPDDALWTPVRLRRRWPTVEYRSPDATLPSETLRLVGDLSRLIDQTRGKPVVVGREVGVHSAAIVVPPFPTVAALARDAAARGIDSEALVEYLDRLGIEPRRYRPLDRRLPYRRRLRDRERRHLRLALADLFEEDVLRL